MKYFIRKVDGFCTNNIYYSDTDSVFIEKYWDVLDRAALVGGQLRQGKNDYENGGKFHGLFLAPKIKYCLTVD